MSIKEYKRPIYIIVAVISVLMILLMVGYAVGIISDDPDGLERTLIDANGGGAQGEEWLDGLSSIWNPILGWIENEYIAGIVGVLLSLFIMVSIFYIIAFMAKKKAENRITPVIAK